MLEGKDSELVCASESRANASETLPVVVAANNKVNMPRLRMVRSVIVSDIDWGVNHPEGYMIELLL